MPSSARGPFPTAALATIAVTARIRACCANKLGLVDRVVQTVPRIPYTVGSVPRDSGHDKVFIAAIVVGDVWPINPIWTGTHAMELLCAVCKVVALHRWLLPIVRAVRPAKRSLVSRVIQADPTTCDNSQGNSVSLPIL